MSIPKKNSTPTIPSYDEVMQGLQDEPTIPSFNDVMGEKKNGGLSGTTISPQSTLQLKSQEDEESGLYPNADPAKYETKLPIPDEPKFQSWLDANYKQGKIPKGDYDFYKKNGYGYDYDFRAAFQTGQKAEINKQDGKWHWNDIGKKPNEPTFSDQSKYNGVDGYKGGTWNGNSFIHPSQESIDPKSFEIGRNKLAAGQQSPSDNTTSTGVQQTILSNEEKLHHEENAKKRADYAEKVKKATPIAIESAAKKSLKIKGLNPNNAALLNSEKQQFAKQVENGNASIGFGKDGEVGLINHPGFVSSFYNHMTSAIDDNKNSREFAKMSIPERVKFANNEQKEKPSPYLKERAEGLASVGAMAGGALPTLALYGAGAAAGGLIEMAAPETGGLSNLAMKPVMSFVVNAGSGANHKGMEGTLSRFYALKKAHPEMNDEEAMAHAGKGEDVDRLAGIAETALFSQTGSVLGKSATGSLLKGMAKSGIDVGAKTALVEGAKDIAHNVEGVENKNASEVFNDMANTFEANAPAGFALHGFMGVITGAAKVPEMIKSALKYDVVTKIPTDVVHAELENNVKNGAISPEEAKKAIDDLNKFDETLRKIPDGLNDDAKASVAGLILKRDNIVKGAESKDKTAQNLIKQQTDAIDNQIQEIYRTGKPLEHEINPATGETFKQPTFDDVAKQRVEDLAIKISKGNRIEEPEDLQTQASFHDELEKQLQRISKEEKSSNKDKENPNTELSDNIEKYLKKYNAEKEVAKIPDTEKKAGTTDESVNKVKQPAEEKPSSITVIQPSENTKPNIVEGKPNEPPPIEGSGIVNEGEPELTKMANAVNDAHVQGKFGAKALDEIIGKLQDTGLKNIYEKVKDKVQRGVIDFKNVREMVMTTKSGSEEDQAALLYDLAELKGKESEITKEINLETDETKVKGLQHKLMDVQNEMMDNALANRLIGRSASSIFRLRQLWVNKEKNIVDMVEEYKAAKGIKELTPEQEQHVKERFNLIQESKAKMQAAKMELDRALEENAKLKEENKKLEELKGTASNQKKADRKVRSDEAISKSNERIKKSKDTLKGLRGNLNSGFDPRVAIEIGKMAAEKVYQGVVKFDELVKNVLDDVKEVFPSWTESDVVNHLLTTKGKDGKLIPSLTSEAYLKSKKLVDRSNASYKEKVKAYGAAQKEVALQQFEWQKDRRIDMMKSRPMKERILDSILRWQRFAVLSYPATMVKLAAVVGHQLALKPLKFAAQWAVSKLTPESIASKQRVWGSPKWSALSKYYSTFIRNFALKNLKEQFSGIDTKELLYGDRMMYDEWNAANGLLEMPGRSHGYIKSFIKNPEFAFAHEQQINTHITKMADIQKELDRTDLSKTKREELEKEYENNDVTNEDVMERINKLSLEHGKWSIMMNDNKFVEKFQKFAKDNGIVGALIKSELPIVKIPTNYIGRYFALKYGLIRSIIGKPKWEGKENNYPGVAELLIKGTKDLTNEQADLLGRALTLGSMGAGLFALGYIARNKIKKNDDGSAEVAGVHVSKNLTHSPELESLFSGSDMAKYKEGKKDFLPSFVENDIETVSKNPFLQTLQYGFIANSVKAMSELVKGKNAGNTDKFEEKMTDAISKKVTDMIVPGFVKQPAQWMDTKESGIHPMGEVNKRYPSSDNLLERFWQQMELGVPVLRKNVPIPVKKSSGKSGTYPTYKSQKAKDDYPKPPK